MLSFEKRTQSLVGWKKVKELNIKKKREDKAKKRLTIVARGEIRRNWKFGNWVVRVDGKKVAGPFQWYHEASDWVYRNYGDEDDYSY